MKALVKVRFYDSHAKVTRLPGDIIEVTPARFNEIHGKGRFIEAYTEPVEKGGAGYKEIKEKC